MKTKDIVELKSACWAVLNYLDDPSYAEEVEQKAKQTTDGNVSGIERLAAELVAALQPLTPTPNLSPSRANLAFVYGDPSATPADTLAASLDRLTAQVCERFDRLNSQVESVITGNNSITTTGGGK